ncbi:hypothetical protein OR16_21863 [Cupriavidus basilensis OR16]|uniref:Uncharacterized protein n=1 Tax=Cupriavidus basilensis OR16 TaxID=1127483 RepID=H1S8Q1_9BURK|nr:hypothetical protein [Cupriavidus basilensis]EHP41093.1 hypothetical protein OR16_21863 [Cupriavidus basilensis OR16]
MTEHTRLELQLHRADHAQLDAAAIAAGYSLEEYARLALHRFSLDTLEAAGAPRPAVSPALPAFIFLSASLHRNV